MSFYHWKFEFSIVWVHVFNLFARGRSEDLDDLDELIDARISRENWLAQEQLGKDASRGPDVDLASVICSTKDQLRSAIISRAYIRNVRLVLNRL